MRLCKFLTSGIFNKLPAERLNGIPQKIINILVGIVFTKTHDFLSHKKDKIEGAPCGWGWGRSRGPGFQDFSDVTWRSQKNTKKGKTPTDWKIIGWRVIFWPMLDQCWTHIGQMFIYVGFDGLNFFLKSKVQDSSRNLSYDFLRKFSTCSFRKPSKDSLKNLSKDSFRNFPVNSFSIPL